MGLSAPDLNDVLHILVYAVTCLFVLVWATHDMSQSYACRALIVTTFIMCVGFFFTMAIGLTGGIASGKTEFEYMFRQQGYCVFDTDVAEFIIRTGKIELEKNNDLLLCSSLVDLIKEESKKVISRLNAQFPKLYDDAGTFLRDELLSYINDDEVGSDNMTAYNDIINPASVKFYQAWRETVKQETILSQAVLVERGNLNLVDELYVVYASKDAQLKNLLKRQAENNSPISLIDAKKAINRQLSFEKKLGIAKYELGKDNVHILNNKISNPYLW